MPYFLGCILMALTIFVNVAIAENVGASKASRESIIEYLEVTGMYKLALGAQAGVIEAMREGLNQKHSIDSSANHKIWEDVVQETRNKMSEQTGEAVLNIRLKDKDRKKMSDKDNNKDKEEKRVAFEKRYELGKQKYYDLMIPIYQKYYSEDDLKIMSLFYKSKIERNGTLGCIEEMLVTIKAGGQAGYELGRKAMDEMIPTYEKRKEKIGNTNDALK
jgi:hypothetical protein